MVRVKDKIDWLGAGWMKFRVTLDFKTSGSKSRVMSRVVIWMTTGTANDC